tara:strand:+ start:11321 stop:12523 length:1203 start_codon:yes stop_codon:yes gene_type:complete
MLFKELYELLLEPKLSEDSATGGLTLTDDVASKLLNAETKGIYNGIVNYDSQPFSLSSNKESLAGKMVTIEIDYLVDQVFKNPNSLLDSKTHLIYPPEQFMLLDLSNEIQQKNGNNNIEWTDKYFELTQILQVLSNTKDHSDVGHQWYFLHRGKLEFTVEYNADYAELCDLDGHKIFLEIMDSDEHRQQKIYIIQETLVKLLGSEKTNQRFTKLLSMLPEFFITFEQSYRLFVASFSFDDLRKEYEERYREYISKMNESLSDATTKALAIPASLLFAITRMESVDPQIFKMSETVVQTAINSARYQHIAMITVITIVSILVWLLSQSHKNSLNAIETEYSNLMERLSAQTQSDESETRKKITGILSQLDNRKSSVKKMLTFIQWIAVLSPLLSVLYMAIR